MIATCVVTHDRLAYSKRCVESWFDTARPTDRLIIVDNASSDGTREWLATLPVPVIFNATNRYPGAACNQGWDRALALWEPTFLHRSDNDVEYLPGWGDAVEAAFADALDQLVVLGILNLHEDRGREADVSTIVEYVPTVGGTCVVPAAVYRDGLRWDEKPWRFGANEDSYMCAWANRRGRVGRLVRTVANNMAFNRYDDYPEYYDRTAAVRGLSDARRSV